MLYGFLIDFVVWASYFPILQGQCKLLYYALRNRLTLCCDLLSVAFIPVLTSSMILDLVKGISHDDAKKVAIRLGVPRNFIDNTSSSADPELHAHELIEQWQKNFIGTEKEAIVHLSTAFKNSGLASYAARLLPRNYPHAGCPEHHPVLQPPIEMFQVQLPEASQLLGLPYSSAESTTQNSHMLPPSSPKQLSCSATVLLSSSQMPHVLPNSSSVQLPKVPSQVQLPQMLPCSTQMQPSRARVQLLGTLTLVKAAILNLKDRKGSPQKDIIGYISTNCGACKDIPIKRALIKGIARGVVTCHLRPDGCIGFKLANLECCYTCLQHAHHHVYIRQSHPRCHHTNLHFKRHCMSLQRGYFKRYLASPRVGHLKYHLTSSRGNHFKRHLTSPRGNHFKRHLASPRGSHFKHHLTSPRGSHFNCQHSRLGRNHYHLRCRHTGKLSDEQMGMITISPSTVHSEDIGDAPTPIPTPTDNEATVPEHLKAESPHKAAVTTPVVPFPTPGTEDDVAPPKDTIHRILPQPETSHEAKVHEDILKVFFITIIGTRDSSTIASVGRALLGDCKFEQIVNHEQQEHTKRVITHIFEEWKQECKGDLDFRKLCDIFREVGCNDLVKRTELFIRKQIRLFSFDESI